MSTAETFGRSAVAEPGAALSATGKPLTGTCRFDYLWIGSAAPRRSGE